MSRSILGLATTDQRPNLHYEITDPVTGNTFRPPETTGWRYAKERMVSLVAEGCILFPVNPNGRPREKKFRADLTSEFTSISTIVDNVFTSEGTSEIRDIFGAQIFDFPKPSKLIRQFVEQAVEGGDFVLDFFAGSGPAGQAVMDLNKEDGGNRKFILVQLPERTDEKSEAFKAGYQKISDITIERNKRVIARITQEQAEKQQQGLFEQEQKPYSPGFKTYRLVKSHFPRVEFQPNPEKTAEENIALLKQYIVDKEATLYSLFNEADIFDEVMLKNGFQLNYSREALAEFTANSVYRVSDGHKTALVCLDAELKKSTVSALIGCDRLIAPEGAPTEDVGAGFSRDEIFICLERAVDTTKKWNLKHQFGEKLVTF